jgi:hypothetical protein
MLFFWQFGSPAAKNGSPGHQASSIFNPWDVHLGFDIFKMAVIAMVNMKVKKLFVWSYCNESSHEWSLGYFVHLRFEISKMTTIVI